MEKPLPGMSRREVYESMTPEALARHIVGLGEQVSQLESEMDLAADVLEGGYGKTVEEVLFAEES